MSAIFGLLAKKGSEVKLDDLHAMGARLRSPFNGPAEIGRDPLCGLGVLPLSETGRSRDAWVPKGGRRCDLSVVCDARFDNKAELASALGLEPRGASEESIVAAAYRKWGTQCFERFRGDFACAIWDPASQSLICARDIFGVRPLYYGDTSGQFAFASEIKGLLPILGREAGVNVSHVAIFLAGFTTGEETTSWDNIRCLAPAHFLTLREGVLTVQRFDWLGRLRPEAPVKPADYPEHFRALFFSAVQKRLGSTGSTGCLLSGGLDSSSIASVARQLRAPVATFSDLYPHFPECDESAYIGTIVDAGGYRPHYRDVPVQTSLNDLRSLIWRHDEPFLGLGMLSSGSLYPDVRKAGCTAVLDGHAGDEVLSHYSFYYQDLARHDHWLRLAVDLWPNARVVGTPYWSRLFQLLGSEGRIASIRRAVGLRTLLKSRLLRKPPLVTGSPRWADHLSPSLVTDADLVNQRSLWRQRQCLTAGSEREAHHRYVAGAVEMPVLPELGRQASAAGVEPRYPFLDRELVEFCLAAPASVKVSGGWPRALLRNGLRKDLPKVIRQRVRKANFLNQTASILSNLGRDTLTDFVSENLRHHREWFSESWMMKSIDHLFSRNTPVPAVILAFGRSLVTMMWLREQHTMSHDGAFNSQVSTFQT